MADPRLTPPPTSLACFNEEYSSDTREVLSGYTRYKISALRPGPVQATFTGVLVNLQNNPSTANRPTGARGGYTLILRDETGEIKVWGRSFIQETRGTHQFSGCSLVHQHEIPAFAQLQCHSLDHARLCRNFLVGSHICYPQHHNIKLD